MPNIDSRCRAKSRGNMFHEGHVFNFDPWALRAVAPVAGLEEAAETGTALVQAHQMRRRNRNRDACRFATVDRFEGGTVDCHVTVSTIRLHGRACRWSGIPTQAVPTWPTGRPLVGTAFDGALPFLSIADAARYHRRP